MKYLVSLEYTYHTTIEVDAETFADAVEEATNNPKIGTITENELEDPQVTWMRREDGAEIHDLSESEIYE